MTTPTEDELRREGEAFVAFARAVGVQPPQRGNMSQAAARNGEEG